MPLSMHDKTTTDQDKADIHRVMTAWSAALEAKDVVKLLADYAPDAVLYDAIPPYKTEGADNIRKVWENCLPYFPEHFKSEHRDVVIHVAGDVALVHGIHHFVPTPPDHPCGQTWMRVSIGFRRVEGNWKVVHEHVSIPFNPVDNHAWFIVNPDVADIPNYGGGCESSSR